MNVLGPLLFLLGIWWVALSLLIAKDHVEREKKRRRLPQPLVDGPQDLVDFTQPKWPSWGEFRARPALFFMIPWCGLLYILLFVLIWPGVLIHKIFVLYSRERDRKSAR